MEGTIATPAGNMVDTYSHSIRIDSGLESQGLTSYSKPTIAKPYADRRIHARGAPAHNVTRISSCGVGAVQTDMNAPVIFRDLASHTLRLPHEYYRLVDHPLGVFSHRDMAIACYVLWWGLIALRC